MTTGTLVTSPFSDDIVPHLSERDARVLAGGVTEALRRLGALPTRMGVHLDHDGMWFSAELNGKAVSARTGQGGFTYEQVAKDLVLASTDPDWNRLILAKG